MSYALSVHRFIKGHAVSFVIIFTFSLTLVYGGMLIFYKNILSVYENQNPPLVFDRAHNKIAATRNAKGYEAVFVNDIQNPIKDLLIQKEDKLFYYHPGINPGSLTRASIKYLISGRFYGASTITEQLVKNLLGNELKRTFPNKIKEAVYALSLELYATKREILIMYLNTAYFGNSIQGIEAASNYYFNKSQNVLQNYEILELLATLNSPSLRYPGTESNKKMTKRLASILKVAYETGAEEAINSIPKKSREASDTSFEISFLEITCDENCNLTVDEELTQKVREVLYRNLMLAAFQSVKNGAVVIIKLPENELLAIIGSPNPQNPEDGYQINMALAPRPIGSTAKPFFYAEAFEKGARPYSLIEDQEVKYTIGTGFEFYPKNYDGKYRGTVTLHQALSNSLNIPSVLTLEFAGLENFYDFLLKDLSFLPQRPLHNYGLGIALGGLEMDLLTLSNYYTVFGNGGDLKPLTVAHQNGAPVYYSPPMAKITEDRKAVDKSFVQLINKILSDRMTGVQQFGLRSQLNLPHNSYALKTGTSRDYHDSWTVGYTPDFLVGVWIGNHDNKPMNQVSGQVGAGRVWHEVMEIMINSPYNKKREFDYSLIAEKSIDGNLEYGLPNDDVNSARNLLLKNNLILQPHNGDAFLWQKDMSVPLKARSSASWFINGSYVADGEKLSFRPQKLGAYVIRAESGGKSETVTIEIKEG